MVSSITKYLCDNNRQSIYAYTSKYLREFSKEDTSNRACGNPGCAPAWSRTSGVHFQHHHECVQSSHCLSPEYKNQVLFHLKHPKVNPLIFWGEL